jgi:hypothetical protein
LIILGGKLISLLQIWVLHPGISTSPRFRKRKGQGQGAGFEKGLEPRPPERLEIFPARDNINYGG